MRGGGPQVHQTGEFIGGRYAYIEASDLLGARLELLEYDNKPL